MLLFLNSYKVFFVLFHRDLSTKFGVSGIPTLIVIKPNGDVVEKNGRGCVQGKDKAPSVTLAEWKSACGV